jgi:hypothetical protein
MLIKGLVKEILTPKSYVTKTGQQVMIHQILVVLEMHEVLCQMYDKDYNERNIFNTIGKEVIFEATIKSSKYKDNYFTNVFLR